MLRRCVIAGAFAWSISGQHAYGQLVTSNLEIKLIPNVGAAWQTISLENTYDDAIVVCNYNLPSAAATPAVPPPAQSSVVAASLPSIMASFQMP